MDGATGSSASRDKWREKAKRRRVSHNRRPMVRRKGAVVCWTFWLLTLSIVPAALLIA